MSFRVFSLVFGIDDWVDLAQHVFEKAGVSAIRRIRKTDNNRVALAVGATIVNRIEDIRESDVGTNCGLFNIEKIGDECVFSSSSFFPVSLDIFVAEILRSFIHSFSPSLPPRYRIPIHPVPLFRSFVLLCPFNPPARPRLFRPPFFSSVTSWSSLSVHARVFASGVFCLPACLACSCGFTLSLRVVFLGRGGFGIGFGRCCQRLPAVADFVCLPLPLRCVRLCVVLALSFLHCWRSAFGRFRLWFWVLVFTLFSCGRDGVRVGRERMREIATSCGFFCLSCFGFWVLGFVDGRTDGGWGMDGWGMGDEVVMFFVLRLSSVRSFNRSIVQWFVRRVSPAVCWG